MAPEETVSNDGKKADREPEKETNRSGETPDRDPSKEREVGIVEPIDRETVKSKTVLDGALPVGTGKVISPEVAVIDSGPPTTTDTEAGVDVVVAIGDGEIPTPVAAPTDQTIGKITSDSETGCSEASTSTAVVNVPVVGVGVDGAAAFESSQGQDDCPRVDAAAAGLSGGVGAENFLTIPGEALLSAAAALRQTFGHTPVASLSAETSHVIERQEGKRQGRDSLSEVSRRHLGFGVGR